MNLEGFILSLVLWTPAASAAPTEAPLPSKTASTEEPLPSETNPSYLIEFTRNDLIDGDPADCPEEILIFARGTSETGNLVCLVPQAEESPWYAPRDSEDMLTGR